MQYLSYAVGLVGFVCIVLTLIKIFQDKEKNGVLHGIIGIVTCGIWALIWGFINRARLGTGNYVLIYAACFVINILLAVMIAKG